METKLKFSNIPENTTLYNSSLKKFFKKLRITKLIDQINFSLSRDFAEIGAPSNPTINGFPTKRPAGFAYWP